MLSANDFPAVWIPTLIAYAIGFRSGAAFLKYLICLIPPPLVLWVLQNMADGDGIEFVSQKACVSTASQLL